MKTLMFALAAVLLLLTTVNAETAAGPRGGRLLPSDPPQAEVLIQPDRFLSVAFYDATLKQVPPAAQSVTAVAEAPEGRVSLPLERAGDLLVSKAPLPEGSGYNIVIQLKQSPTAKPQNFRFKYNLNVCGGCDRPEYACTCDH